MGSSRLAMDRRRRCGSESIAPAATSSRGCLVKCPNREATSKGLSATMEGENRGGWRFEFASRRDLARRIHLPAQPGNRSGKLPSTAA
jgi:hypothetical protein